MKVNAVNGAREELTGAKERQEESRSGDNSGREVAKLRRLRLKALLWELVDEEGRMEAAEMLGVAYRTLVRAEETGQITGHMRDALHRLLGSRHGPELARLRERVSAQEWQVKNMARRLGQSLNTGSPQGSQHRRGENRDRGEGIRPRQGRQGDRQEDAARRRLKAGCGEARDRHGQRQRGPKAAAVHVLMGRVPGNEASEAETS